MRHYRQTTIHSFTNLSTRDCSSVRFWILLSLSDSEAEDDDDDGLLAREITGDSFFFPRSSSPVFPSFFCSTKSDEDDDLRERLVVDVEAETEDVSWDEDAREEADEERDDERDDVEDPAGERGRDDEFDLPCATFSLREKYEDSINHTHPRSGFKDQQKRRHKDASAKKVSMPARQRPS
jgi:hypothetical protein